MNNAKRGPPGRPMPRGRPPMRRPTPPGRGAPSRGRPPAKGYYKPRPMPRGPPGRRPPMRGPPPGRGRHPMPRRPGKKPSKFKSIFYKGPNKSSPNILVIGLSVLVFIFLIIFLWIRVFSGGPDEPPTDDVENLEMKVSNVFIEGDLVEVEMNIVDESLTLDSVRFVVEGPLGQEIFLESYTGSDKFYLNLEKLTGEDVEKISVYPIFIDSDGVTFTGELQDTYTVVEDIGEDDYEDPIIDDYDEEDYDDSNQSYYNSTEGLNVTYNLSTLDDEVELYDLFGESYVNMTCSPVSLSMFSQASKTCSNTQTTCYTEADIFGMGAIHHFEIYYRTEAVDPGNCIFSEEIYDIGVSYSDELIDYLVSEGEITRQEVDDLIEQSNTELEYMIGQFAICNFSVQEISDLMDGWDTEDISVDLNAEYDTTLPDNCYGNLFGLYTEIPNCTSHNYYECSGEGNVYWYDSCDYREEVKDYCAVGEVCESGACVSDTPTEPACGDNFREAGEYCDGVDIAGETCSSFGYDSGYLACNSYCEFDISNCYNENGGEDPQCTLTSTYHCNNGDVWFYDTCGSPSQVKENCITGQTCVVDMCVDDYVEPPQADPWEIGIVSWWDFDLNANDKVGSNHGTINGGASLVSSGCKSGSCYDFDGNNDYIDVGTFSVSGNKLTIAAWAKWEGSSFSLDPRIISKADGVESSDHVFLLGLDESSGSAAQYRFRFTAGTSALSFNAGSAIPDNTWHHIVAVYDGSTARIYVDKILIGSNTKSGNLETNNNEVNIGRNPVGDYQGWRYWEGKLDEVMIWNRALSSSEITQLYDHF
jgi:hypothetical protein